MQQCKPDPVKYAALTSAWFVVGYLFFSMVAIREPRYDMTILFPVILFAVLFLAQVLRFLPAATREAVPIVLTLGTAALSLNAGQVPYVKGYEQAARYVTDHAPKGNIGIILGLPGRFVYLQSAPT